MNGRIAIPILALLCSSALAKDNSRMKVIVLENVPTATSYIWQVAGKDSISCYDTGCTGYYMPPDSGTADVQGAVLKLLLPDSRIVIAECVAKPDVGQNLANAMAGAQASTMYRSCRVPEMNSTLDAEFRGSNVKLFMQSPSIDGSGRVYTETYRIKGVLQPTQSSEMINERLAEMKAQLIGNVEESRTSPAFAAGDVLDHAPTKEEWSAMVKAARGSYCVVVTSPSGAEIDIDGKRLGKSPLTFVLLRKGDALRTITIRKEGYLTIERKLVPDGTEMPLGLTLEPEKSSLAK